MGLWVIGRVELGLSEVDFWRSSPRELLRLLDRKRELVGFERTLDDWRFGKVLALIANLFATPKTGGKGYEPSDFFPNLPQGRKREQTPEEMLRVMKSNSAIMKRFGG